MLAGWPELKGKSPSRNWLGRFFLTHLYRFFKLKRPYTLEDIPESVFEPQQMVDIAESTWAKYKGYKHRLWRCMFAQFGLTIFGVGFCSLMKGLCAVCMAVLMKLVMSNLDDGYNSKTVGGCVGLIVIDLAMVVFDRLFNSLTNSLSMNLRMTITGLIYRNLMATKVSALQFTSDGQLSNFLGSDVERLFMCIHSIQYVLVAPLIVVAIFIVLYVEMGAMSLWGYAAVAILSIIQGIPMTQLQNQRKQAAIFGDKRLTLVNEAIKSVFLIKACVWEAAVSRHIDKARNTEASAKIRQAVLEALKDAFDIVNRLGVLLLVTAIYTITDHEISVLTIFPMSYLYSLSCEWFPSNFLWGLRSVIFVKVSMDRVTKFLELSDEQIAEGVILNQDKSFENPLYPFDKPRDAPTSGDQESAEKLLVRDSSGNSVDLSANSRRLIGFTGGSATGKTTFINELLGFREGGSTKRLSTKDGRIGYAAQSPWIFPGTLRENILCGLPFQLQRYWDVIRNCCLYEDLGQFKFGDQTRVGFGGVTLSGGQQARVSLARAVYADTDIYVFDDPFSAINHKVAKRIMKLCIQKFLNGKTRIVVLKDDKFLSICDNIIVFPITGSPDQLASTEDEAYGDFGARQRSKILSDSEPEATDDVKSLERRQLQEAPDFDALNANDVNDILSPGGEIKRRHEIKDRRSPAAATPLYRSFTDGELSKSVSWRVYGAWARSAGIIVVIILFLLFTASRAVMNLSDLWLLSWTGSQNDSDTRANITLNNWYYWHIYLIYVTVTFILVIPLGIGWKAAFLKAASRIHMRMIRSVLRAPMAFINQKSLGEITNRFSRDINEVDWIVIFGFYIFFRHFFSLISYLVVIVILNKYLIIVIIPAFFAVMYLRHIYLKATQQLARLDAETKSPYFTHFSISFSGLPTIRCLRAEHLMVADFHKFQKVCVSVVAIVLDSLTWLDLMVGLVGVVFVAGVSFGCLIISVSSNSSSSMGLALMYALCLLQTMQQTVRNSVEFDNKMVHTERMLEFAALPREDPSRGNQNDPEKDDEAFKTIRPFPIRNGRIEVKNVNLRYAPDSPWVLRNFTLDIAEHEKICLAGRTGCGKSSLFNVILRMYDYDGTVSIDGSDINRIALPSLRKGISVMTQQPILYTSTVRWNLDPNGVYTDAEIWRTLEMVNMKDVVQRMPAGIETEISPQSLEWSGGQRQMFCMARTLLEDRKIVLMDEPTASMDATTSRMLLDKVAVLLKDKTLIIVSHAFSQLPFVDHIINMDATADKTL